MGRLPMSATTRLVRDDAGRHRRCVGWWRQERGPRQGRVVDAVAFDTGDQVGDHRAGEHPLDDHALEVLGTADARGTEFFEGCHLLWTLDGHTVLPMDRAADNLIDVTWVAWAAERLREQWPRIDGATLEETGRESTRSTITRSKFSAPQTQGEPNSSKVATCSGYWTGIQYCRWTGQLTT